MAKHVCVRRAPRAQVNSTRGIAVGQRLLLVQSDYHDQGLVEYLYQRTSSNGSAGGAGSLAHTDE